MLTNDSPEPMTLAMADAAHKSRKADPLTALAVLFFLLAVGFASAPAWNAGFCVRGASSTSSRSTSRGPSSARCSRW